MCLGSLLLEDPIQSTKSSMRFPWLPGYPSDNVLGAELGLF